MTGKTIKILSIVLAVMMLFSALPLTAYAAETDAAETGVGGDIGDCTWTYNTYSNTLTISGSGNMPNDIDTMRWGGCPWESYKASIQKVVIGNDVKNITPYSFYQCRNLTEVQIGTSVEEIGESAFSFTDLSDLTLPDSVRVLGGDAFAFNENLTHVRMSKNIEWIGSRAFYDSDIHYAVIPKKDVVFDTDGEGMAFGYKRGHDESGDPRDDRIYGFTMAGIPGGTVEKEITDNYYGVNYYEWKFVAISGKTGACDWFFDPETGTLTISGNGKMKDYLFVDGEEQYVQDTPWKGFSDEIKKVVIEDGVENVGDYAFPYCYYLNEIVIGGSVKYIGTSAFDCAGMAGKSMADLYIPDSVTSIGENAFADCVFLKNVRMSKNIGYIGARAFLDTDLSSIVIPTWMPQLGRYCFGFQDEGAPTENFTVYGLELSSTNEYCMEYGLKFVVIGDKAGTWYFDVDTRELTININGAMADYSYQNPAPWSPLYTYDPDDRWTLTFIGNTTHIGDYAFYHLPIKGSVMLPYTCTSVGQSAFCYCGYIESVSCENVESFGAQAFSGCETLTNVNLDAAKTIGDSAFNNCYNLNTVMFGSNLTDIGEYAFTNANLTSIIIPASVVTIGDSAFNSNYNLDSLLFAENSHLTTIGGHAFQYARNLYSVAIPDSVTEIGDYAFAENNSLSDLTLGSSVQIIGDGAFYKTDIHMVKCPASLQTIGERAFGYKAAEHNPDYYETTGRFDFYGPTGSPAKAYADQEDDFYFHEIASHTLTDETTGVKVDTFEENVQLVVEKKETGSVVIEVDGVIIGVYDISLQRDDTDIQPEEPVTVHIPCDYYGATVYRVESDGTLTDMNAVSDGEHVEFTTDHFSLYVVTKPVSYYLGDANWDDSIESIDATWIQRHLSSMLGPNDPFSENGADVDGDGEVTIVDATWIQRYLAQFKVPYPVGEAR